MNYRIVHRTTYKYRYSVSFGTHVACLTPRSMPNHRCVWNELRIHPLPATRSERVDFFGNQLSFFTVQDPHKELVVEARSEMTVDEHARLWPEQSAPWEEVAKSLADGQIPAEVEASQFLFESPRVRLASEFAQYASRSFLPERPLTEALLDLTARIHKDFRFDSKATNVRTPTEEFFRKRCGVCQDFTHLQIACLRSLGLAARYVSGYLRTYSPSGGPRLSGADASHAWVSVYCPGAGWVDVDPTNNLVPSQNHVTLGWGRDYGDVSPLRGLILGGRDHTLRVAVSMEPLDSSLFAGTLQSG
jgi:transglutaminase-like putative cysteine protease